MMLCPLIDPFLRQQGSPLLQRLYLGVLCSLFDVQYCALDCYYQLSELRSPIPPSPVSEEDRMDTNSFLSLPIITGSKGSRALEEGERAGGFVKWEGSQKNYHARILFLFPLMQQKQPCFTPPSKPEWILFWISFLHQLLAHKLHEWLAFWTFLSGRGQTVLRRVRSLPPVSS